MCESEAGFTDLSTSNVLPGIQLPRTDVNHDLDHDDQKINGIGQSIR